MRKLFIIFLISFTLYGDIGGVIFKDFNLNGKMDRLDSKISNISLKAVCSDGEIYSTTTKNNGTYRFVLNGDLRCRLELENDQSWIKSGNNGSGKAYSSVSFAENGELNHNISITTLNSYCKKSPKVIISTLPGGPDGSDGNPENHGSLFSLPTPKKGTFDKDFTKRKLLKSRQEVGAIWGLAYDKINKNIFASSVIKRYVPLLGGCKDEDNKKNGCAGRIYSIPVDGNGDVKVLVDLGNKEVGYTLTQKRNYDGMSKQNDKEVIALSGRAGLGDLELSEDGKYLYTINLYKKELIKIEIATGEVIFKKLIPNPYGKACNDEMVRPWALNVNNGSVFIGSVCENRISNGYPTEVDHTGELGGAIQKFDGESFSNFAFTNTLNYLKPRPYLPEKDDAEPVPQIDQNNNWKDTDYYGQPILSDIEFDSMGNLLLAYTDRGAFIRQRGNSSGDLRKMCKNADGSYTDESTGVAPTDCESHTVQYIKDGNKYYEFYRGDFYDENHSDYGATGHPETASGAVAMRGGDANLYLGMSDSTSPYEAGSIGILNNSSGEKIAAQALIDPSPVAQGGEREMYGSKAGGIGDIELLCDLAPAEIGNYIWNDENKNGIQDPDEYGITGVKVKLYSGKSCNGNLIGEATTNSDGEYYFGGLKNINLKKDMKILPNKDYSICISLMNEALDNMSITKRDALGKDGDKIDSDAYDDSNGFAKINFKTDLANSSNHSLDAGFTLNSSASFGDSVWNDKNQNGIQDSGESGVAGIKVTLYKGDGTELVTTTTDSNGKYLFENLDAGDYYAIFDLKTLPKNYQVSPRNRGENDELDSDVDPNSGKTETITLEAGQENFSLDMGIYKKKEESKKYCIGDFVWLDKNRNGIQDSGESGVAGVTLKLFPTGATITTDSSGKYSFCGLENGDYQVEVVSIPAGYTITESNSKDDNIDSDIDPKSKKSQTIKLKDQNITDLDVGLIKKEESKKYCIGDFVWLDKNRNGIQDSGESGVAGVTLKLFPTGATITTDSSGKYSFCGLGKGTYQVEVDKDSLVSGYFIGVKDFGNDDNIDSDINPISGLSDLIVIEDRDILDIDLAIVHCGNNNGGDDDIVSSTDSNNQTYCQGANCNSPISGADDSSQSNTADCEGEGCDSPAPTKSGVNTAQVISKSDRGDLPKIKIAKIDIEKHTNSKDADTEDDAVPLVDGIDITWEYIVSNIGEDTIDNIKVIDDKEGLITCPKSSLAPATKMICTKKGTAKYESYKNTATVTGKARTSGVQIKDKDSSCYITRYLIGSHFWVDSNKDGIYQEGIEEPIPNALIELFDGDGNKVAETRTNEKGEYSFYVKAGDYYVRFHLPDEFKEKGYIFEAPKNNNDNSINANNANEQGFTMLVTVGPEADDKHKIKNLTLDGAIDCGCDAPGIEQGSGDAFGKFFGLLLILLTILIGLKEIEAKQA